TFECDFFLDVNLTELYTTLVLEFDVIEWYHFAEDAQLIAANLQERHDSHLGERLAFLIAGGASKVIVPTSEVAVSRTEVSFNTANMSAQSFIHGSDYHLLIYENGWKPAPTIIDSWGVPSLGFGIRMRGGEIIEDRFNFEFWHGALANGRYMIIRQHAEDHMRPGAPRVQETLMVEFIINNNTPINLMLQLHPQAWSSVGKIYHPVYSTHLGRDIGSKATPRKKAAMGIASAKPLTAPSPARMLTCAK
ncbi:MAG: hypothetical protein FWD96_03865, partial [Defluviitaleaceae bacterium]|nr:hypothetical protein [Defluviitaleaceae bacterium]